MSERDRALQAALKQAQDLAMRAFDSSNAK